MTDKILDVFIASLYGVIILSAAYILALLGEPTIASFMRSIGLM